MTSAFLIITFSCFETIDASQRADLGIDISDIFDLVGRPADPFIDQSHRRGSHRLYLRIGKAGLDERDLVRTWAWARPCRTGTAGIHLEEGPSCVRN
jgi:hypothetical protein